MRRYLRKGNRMAEHNYVDDPDAPSPFPPHQHALEAHLKYLFQLRKGLYLP